MDFLTFEVSEATTIEFSVLGQTAFFDIRLETWDPSGNKFHDSFVRAHRPVVLFRSSSYLRHQQGPT